MAEQSAQPKALNEFREIKSETDKKKVHEEALTRFKQIVSREEESRILGVEDLIFIDQEGGTYNEEVGFLSGDARTNTTTTSEDPPAPRYQIDRISPVIEQAVSDQREAQVNILVRVTGEVESGLNDTFNGLIKNIESVSDAEDAYDNMFDECQKSGYGGCRIVTEYADDSFEQNIRIEPILNATQSLFFGPAKKATKQDALYAYYLWWMDMDEFKEEHPTAEHTDWPSSSLQTFARSWFNKNDNLIRIAEYWRKRPVEKEIIQLADGKVIDEEDFIDGMQLARGPDGQERRRKVKTYQVERFIMTGTEVVKGPQKWAGRFIPLIPEYGIRSVIDGREIIRGKVRKGKDAQRIYNYATSAIIKTAAKSSKDHEWMTPAMAEGHIEDYEKMNIDQNPVYFFNPDSDFPQQFPKKTQGPVVQQALIQQVAQAREDISASVGAGVGVQDGTSGDTRSGEAIREGNVNTEKGNSIYLNNHFRAIRYVGLQLADLMARLWTSQRQEKIIKPDGDEEFITINQTVTKTNDAGEIETVIVNDLGQSSFDISLDVGPAYASQRQQGADQLTKLAAENPAFAQDTPDLIAKNLDIPGSKELSKRLRRRGILNGTIEPTDEEREEFNLDEREQLVQELTPQIREEVTQEANIRLILANANQLDAQAGNFNAAIAVKGQEVGLTAAEIEKTLSESNKIMQESLNTALDGMAKMLENFQKQADMGIPLSIREHDQRISQSDNIDEEQQEVSPGFNSEQDTELEQIGTDGQ